ncbi:MAG: phosphopantothenoylcysteine decarboxylase [Anaerocolumna sp.]
MNIIITAGGTTEPIDSVRSITNTSTGMLGSLIANAFAKISNTEKIYYICGKTAVIPPSDKTEIILADTAANLGTAVKKVIATDSIDIIIHSMAVSDYRVKSITSASMLAASVQSGLPLLQADTIQMGDDLVRSLIENPETILNDDGKISSNIDDLILYMERTPKIISLFQTLAPKAILVGFKLLDHVPQETLIDTAFHLLQDNKCKFVLANDLRDISKEQHIGYLIDESKNYKRYTTKTEIAAAIAAVTTEIRRKIR